MWRETRNTELGDGGRAGKAKAHTRYKAVNGLFLYAWASEPPCAQLPCGPEDMDLLLTNDASSRGAAVQALNPHWPMTH